MKKTLLIFAIVLALSTVLWYWDKATRVKATSSVKNTQQAEAKIDGKPAPEVKFKDLDGNDVTLAQYKGTVVLVDFWATWCPPCRMAIPGLNELHRKYKDRGVSIVGISVDENPKALVGFDRETHIEYVSLLTSEKAEKAFGSIVGLPSTFVLDRQGKVYKSYVGEVDRDELESDLQALLAAR